MKHEKSSIVHTETIVLTIKHHVFRSYLIHRLSTVDTSYLTHDTL